MAEKASVIAHRLSRGAIIDGVEKSDRASHRLG